VIILGDPYPLLDAGTYRAKCLEATMAWARQWKKFKARLVMEPQNYTGRPYHGHLCAFLDLGSNPHRPYAGPNSAFRRLWVEVNGDQPTSREVSLDIFVGRYYDVTVETVTLDRHRNERRPEHWYSVIREVHLASF
jgi:hypothetical protein